MNRIKNLAAVLVAGMTLLTAACSDSPGSGDAPDVAAAITVERPAGMEDATVTSESLTLTNVNTGIVSTFGSLSNVSVEPGLYDLRYEAQLTLANGAHALMHAARTSVTISEGAAPIVLEAYANIENDDLIIAEVFFTGTIQRSGNDYHGDDYIKLYNNTDHVIYADGITIFETKFTTTQKYEHTPDIMGEAMNVQALYTVPGSGTDHPVQPGEYFLIADTGIDHRVANPNSFDLRHADFEWYDVSTKPGNLDIDGPDVPNMDKWYCYTLSYWMLHNRGFKAFGIARIPVDCDTYLTEYKYHYDYTLVTVAGTFPMTADAYRLPNEWIVDVVNCSVQSLYAWNLCAPALDSGWTYCGTVDKDKTRFFHSVRRKLLRIADDGRVILKDTNNSTDDFNPGVVASEIELQGTAMDVDGTPCTQVTYDGVRPVKK